MFLDLIVLSIKSGANWAVAGGTFLVAITSIAISLKNIIKEYSERPIINISVNKTFPHTLIVGNTTYLRVKIKNNGKTVAKNCYVNLLQVLRMDKFNSVAEPITLKWAGAPLDSRYLNEKASLRTKNDIYPDSYYHVHQEKMNIPPEDYKFVDLVKFSNMVNNNTIIINPNKVRNINIIGFTGDVRDISLSEDKDGKINYLVYISIVGDNFNAIKKQIYIHNNKNPDKIYLEDLTRKKVPGSK